MTHVRKSIRDAATSAVVGLATTGSRVYASRNLPLTNPEFPCLCVYARSDNPDYESAAFSGGVSFPVRTVALHVQGFVMALDAPSAEDTLDLIAEEVETAIFAAFPFGGALGLTLGSQDLAVDSSGNQSLFSIDMVFNVIYRTAEGHPGDPT